MNVGKSKVMVCGRTERGGNLDLSLNGEMLEEVDSFKYLGSIVSKNGGVVSSRLHLLCVSPDVIAGFKV